MQILVTEKVRNVHFVESRQRRRTAAEWSAQCIPEGSF